MNKISKMSLGLALCCTLIMPDAAFSATTTCKITTCSANAISSYHSAYASDPSPLCIKPTDGYGDEQFFPGDKACKSGYILYDGNQLQDSGTADFLLETLCPVNYKEILSEIHQCVPDCSVGTACSSCGSGNSTSNTAITGGRTYRADVCEYAGGGCLCHAKLVTKCDAHYYGDTVSTHWLDGRPGGLTAGTCNPCPNVTSGVLGYTADGARESIYQCYAPTGNLYTDQTGTYKYTSDCPYTE